MQDMLIGNNRTFVQPKVQTTNIIHLLLYNTIKTINQHIWEEGQPAMSELLKYFTKSNKILS